MTEIVVACRDGILRAPSGEQFRMVRGRTLADARHPAVLANPDTFMPVEVELSMEDTDTGPGHLEDDLSTELAELRETAEQAQTEATEYKAQLVAIVDVLMAAGHVPPGTDTDKPGWVAEIVRGVLRLEQAIGAEQAQSDVADVPPPRSRARKTTVPRG